MIAKVAFTSPDRVRPRYSTTAWSLSTCATRKGGPQTFTLPQCREIKRVALSRPVDHDLPFSTGSLSKLADFLVAEAVVDDISHDGLRTLLREEGVSFQRLKTCAR